MWRHDFFVLRDVHSQHVYLGEESLPDVLRLKKNQSEFVLIIFYLQLIICGHADSSVADKNHDKLNKDKHVVNEHHAARRNTQEKCPHVVHFMYHVTCLKQTRGTNNVALKTAKKFVGVAVYWEE